MKKAITMVAYDDPRQVVTTAVRPVLENGAAGSRGWPVTREGWLRNAAAELLANVVLPAAPGYAAPTFQISVGFPRGPHGRGRAVSQCWHPRLARDGAAHVFVSPERDGTEVVAILGTVAHELIHAVVGTDCGHKGPFRRVAFAVGFAPPLTATSPGEGLSERLNTLADRLGPLPHGALQLPEQRKGSRLRLWECPCGVKARVASDDFDATCNRCGGMFERVVEDRMAHMRREGPPIPDVDVGIAAPDPVSGSGISAGRNRI